MVLIWFWAMCAIFSAVIAGSRGRMWFAWLIVGLLCGPFGLLVGRVRPLNKRDDPW